MENLIYMSKILPGLIIIGFLVSCHTEDKKSGKFKPQSHGMEFKVSEKGIGDPVRYGNWLKMHVVQSFNDSVLSDTRTMMPYYQRYDSTEMTPESLRIFKNISEGDSLEFRVRADSAFGKNPPPFAKEGGYLITRVKVEKIIRTEDEFRYDTALVRGELRKKYERGY